MSKINSQALERVRAAPLTGEGVATILELLWENSQKTGCSPSFVLNYHEVEDEIEEGDMIPVITVTLVRAGAL